MIATARLSVPLGPSRTGPHASFLGNSLPLAALLLAMLSFQSAAALEHVSFQRHGRPVHVSGRLLVEDRQGGVLLETQDGKQWIVPAGEVERRKSDNRPFEPLTADEMAEQLLEELPDGFRIHQTAHYVIAYNTTGAYAEWCGALYERLFRGFYGYWDNRGIELQSPPFPLVAIIFDKQSGYEAYSRPVLGEAAGSMIGYYNLESNRVVMYDLTGVDRRRAGVRRLNNTAHINQILSRPEAERTVATIVHEATHQLAYNSGLQTRYADNPHWVSEGLAIFFESPDLQSSRGWRTIGAVNRVNLFAFRKYLRNRPSDSLATLIGDDTRFRNANSAEAAYGEAWALNYFLLRTQRDAYCDYLRKLGEKSPLVELTPAQRIDEFTDAFGPLEQLDQQFVRYLQRLR